MKRRVFVWLMTVLIVLSMIPMSVSGAQAKGKLKAPKSLSVIEGEGNYKHIRVKMSNNGPFPSMVDFTVSDPTVATVKFDKRRTNQDESYAYHFLVVGEKAGTTTVTFSNKELGPKGNVKCKITVKANTYTRKKPSVGKKKGLYGSPKKMYFDDDELVIDMFLYNKTGKTITGIQGLCIALVSDSDLMDLYDPFVQGSVYQFGDWVPTGGELRNNKYAVVEFRFPYQNNCLDLRSKVPEVYPFAGYGALLSKGVVEKSAKGITAMMGATADTWIDASAMSEVGYASN